MKLIPTIAGLLAIIGAVLGGYLFLDTKYAKCADVKTLERRLDYDIENNRLLRMRDQRNDLYKSYPEPAKAPIATQKQLRELDEDLDMQRDKVKKMEAK